MLCAEEAVNMSFEPTTKATCLVVFDFDQTLVRVNCDLIAIELLASDEIKQRIYATRHQKKWTQVMADCFSLLHDQGLTTNDILNRISKLPMNVGMRELVLQFVQAPANSPYKFELAIVSHANNLFIQSILREQGIEAAFGDRIHTNQVEVVDGKLVASTESDLGTAPYVCDWCGDTSCKSRILREHYMKPASNTSFAYDKVIYIGDGENDCCPVRLLGESDAVFFRRGFRAEQLILDNERNIANQIQAPVNYWTSGFDIYEHLFSENVL